jgi:hypothetical protein
MSLVLACVDGSAYTASVADLAGWAARRLGAGVEVLEVLGRREAQQRRQQDMYDLGAPVAEVARELAAVDAERARLLRKQAELVLEEARFRVEAAGVSDVRTLRGRRRHARHRQAGRGGGLRARPSRLEPRTHRPHLPQADPDRGPRHAPRRAAADRL